MKVPYINLAAQHKQLKSEILSAIGTVLEHSQFILGEEVQEFENEFARLCNVEFALGVNSGTDALILSLLALGIGPGDEVITVPNSFVASASCISLIGATPVFVDVKADYNIDSALIPNAITSKTKAIIPVHLTGRPADMDAITAVAKQYGLFVIEDCAQAVGAALNGNIVGSIGDTGCFSLHPLKTLNACGDGGVITTNNPDLYERMKILRNHGLENRDNSIDWGFNSRLDTIQAAILLVKLQFLVQWTEKRRSNAKQYQDLLNNLNSLVVPLDKPNEYSVYHTFVIQADRRDALKDYLDQSGIGTAIHYPTPIHLQSVSSKLGYEVGNFPISERLAERILSLPVYPELSCSELEYVVDRIHSFYQMG